MRISIQIDLVHHKRHVPQPHTLCCQVGDAGVQVAVAVIGNEHQLLMPLARILVAHIRCNLLCHCLGCCSTRYRQSPYAYIHPAINIRCALIVIQESEIIVRRVGFGLYLAVHCLIRQQGVWPGSGHEFAVVVAAVAEQQQPFRFLLRVLSAVVKHLHDPAVSRSVRRTGRELVIHLLVGNNSCGDGVVLLMGVSNNRCCRYKLLGTNDNKVNVAQRVQVLVLYLAYYRWLEPAVRRVRINSQHGFARCTIGIERQCAATQCGRNACYILLIRYIPNLQITRCIAQSITGYCICSIKQMVNKRHRHLLTGHHHIALCGHLHVVQITATAVLRVGKRQGQSLLTCAVGRQGEPVATFVRCGFRIEVRHKNLVRRTFVRIASYSHGECRNLARGSRHTATDIQIRTGHNIMKRHWHAQRLPDAVQLLAVELTPTACFAGYIHQIDGILVVHQIGGVRANLIGGIVELLGIGNQLLLAYIVCQKIVAITAVRVAGVNEMIVDIIPTVHALCIEQYIVALAEHTVCTFVHIERYRRQIILFTQLEVLTEHTSAVTVDTYLLRIKSRISYLVVRHAMHTGFCNAYLHPFAAR